MVKNILLYEVQILNSKGRVSSTYNKEFESHEKAENWRKTEEVILGFPVKLIFLNELKPETLDDNENKNEFVENTNSFDVSGDIRFSDETKIELVEDKNSFIVSGNIGFSDKNYIEDVSKNKNPVIVIGDVSLSDENYIKLKDKESKNESTSKGKRGRPSKKNN